VKNADGFRLREEGADQLQLRLDRQRVGSFPVNEKTGTA
jgi:hypothetical protein